MTTAGADLVSHMARFARDLRHHGVPVGLTDEADGLVALAIVDIGDRDEVRCALLSALKIQPRYRAAFDRCFTNLWSGRHAAGPRSAAERPADRRTARVPRGGTAAAEREVPAGDLPGYSPAEVLRRKPFDECTPAELASMERLMRQMIRRLATRPSRRRVPSHGKGEVDLRHSFRRAVAYGGEFVSLAFRDTPIERAKLAVVVDTSGSMDPHARFVLAFARALHRVARRTDVFTFNTTLARLTEHVHDGSAGTRIGECLAEFVDHYADQVVDGHTVVLIVSDGLDQGDVQPLPGAMRTLSARARRVLWLNPLAGDARYEPTARAMAAALPYIDRLLPAHNLASLEQVLWAFR